MKSAALILLIAFGAPQPAQAMTYAECIGSLSEALDRVESLQNAVRDDIKRLNPTNSGVGSTGAMKAAINLREASDAAWSTYVDALADLCENLRTPS